jgi:26S proteasome regulatory subunit N1
MKKQLAFLIARAQIPLDWLHTEESGDETQDTLSDEMMACLSNVMLSDHFREFGKELGVTEPKSLEDVYKSHLENTRLCSSPTLDRPFSNAWSLV